MSKRFVTFVAQLFGICRAIGAAKFLGKRIKMIATFLSRPSVPAAPLKHS